MSASFLAVSTSAGAATNPTAPTPTRLSGEDRFASSGEVAKAVCAAAEDANDKVDVIVVNGRNFPDGLAASSLAGNGTGFGAIVLTEADELPASTVAALDHLSLDANCGIDTLTIVGGTSAVSAAVQAALLTWATAKANVPAPTRVSGDDRYATAVEVAKKITSTHAILVTGENYPDALAAGVLSYHQGWPILLNSGSSLRPEVKAYIEANITTVVIVGGPSAVPASIETELNSMNKSYGRASGDDRAATAVALAEYMATPTGVNFGAGKTAVAVVNGWDFPDALSAAPLAAINGAPLLLTRSDSIPASTAKWHVDNAATISNIFVVGGTSVVSAGVVTGAVGAATIAPASLTGATVKAEANTQASVALIANQVTVSASPTGVAAGAAGNGFTVTVVTNSALPLTTPVRVTLTLTTATGSVLVEGRTEALLTAKAVADAWAASNANALFTVARASGTDEALIAPAAAVTTTGGNSKVTVALTFSGKVTVSALPDFEVRNGSTAIAGLTLAGAADADALVLTTGVTALTLVGTVSSPADIPVAGTSTLYVAAGDLTTAGTTMTNATDLTRILAAG
jgi:putative cell wall-binding protein